MNPSRTLVIARADLRRRIRNRSAIITAFVAPLALAVVFSLLVGGGGGPDLRIGVLDLDRSPASSAITSGLTSATESGSVTFAAFEDERSAAAAVEDEHVGAVIVFEPGFEEGAVVGGPEAGAGRIEVRRTADAAITGQVAQSVADSIAASFDRRALTARLAAGRGVDPPAFEEVEAAIGVTDVPVGGREVDAGAFFGASMSILFLFFTVGFGSRSIHAERTRGTLARVLATPATPAEILAGKTAAVALLGLAGFGTVWAVTTFVFDAPWGSPGAVAALIVATVLAISGIAAFVASLARNERQADTATSVVAFAFAMLGGNFVSPGGAPALLQRLSTLTPNGWALRGFTALNADAASLTDVATTLGVLVAFGLVFGGVGLVRAARRMIP